MDRICLRCADAALLEPLEEAARELGLPLDMDGRPVWLEPGGEGHRIDPRGDAVQVCYGTRAAAFRALSLLPETLERQDVFLQSPRFTLNGVLVDASRNAVPKPETLYQLIRRCAAMGLNALFLYTEDTIELPDYPYFGYMRGAYTAQEIRKLDDYADDASVLETLGAIKRANKAAFAAHAKKTRGVELNPDAIFDVQVKRLHEYKRQLLNVLHIIYLYQRLQDDPNMDMRPQTFLFGAKAAPGYAVAKRIIHLINSLAAQIDRDPICRDKLQVVFLENYRVSLAEMLMPASEVSQQISTAGKEASGTGNMKFMMNGALTVGTLDGANVEMHEVLGDENMFLFGLKADEVAHLRRTYDPQLLYQRDPVLRRVVDQLKTGFGDGVTYEDIWQRLVMGGDGPADQYMVLADFAAYCDAEERMSRTYGDRTQWNRMSLLNIARSGIFAADRAIAQYADTIWHVPYKK